jgi:hypothetical protein
MLLKPGIGPKFRPEVGMIIAALTRRMGVSAKPTVVNCSTLRWREALKSELQAGVEVDLINFDYTADGQIVEMLAISHSLNFSLKAAERRGAFRVKSSRAK